MVRKIEYTYYISKEKYEHNIHCVWYFVVSAFFSARQAGGEHPVDRWWGEEGQEL